MHEWSESVWIAISLIGGSLVIAFSALLWGQARDIKSVIYQEQAVADNMREVRKYYAYNDKDVYAQDVVSVILETHGEPYVAVIDGTDVYYWNSSKAVEETANIAVQNATAYSSTDVLTKLNVNTTYHGNLIKSLNGEVIGLKFTKN